MFVLVLIHSLTHFCPLLTASKTFHVCTNWKTYFNFFIRSFILFSFHSLEFALLCVLSPPSSRQNQNFRIRKKWIFLLAGSVSLPFADFPTVVSVYEVCGCCWFSYEFLSGKASDWERVKALKPHFKLKILTLLLAVWWTRWIWWKMRLWIMNLRQHCILLLHRDDVKTTRQHWAAAALHSSRQ